MDLGLAALHAVIEGFFSTLPLSASGHRFAARIWAGESRDLAACVAMAQLGCVAAISIVTRARLGAAFAEGIRGIARPVVLNEGAGRDAVGLTIAALVGALGHGVASTWSSPLNEVTVVAGVGLLLTAAALASTAWAPSSLPPERLGPSPWGAVLVGLAYALAVLPGLSAVAAAYVVARWLGLAAWRAAETALVVSLPALAFGSIRSLVADGARLDAAGVVIAVVVAFVSALVAANLWRAICERQRTALLALWLVPLALAILAYGRALPHPTSDLPLSASV